MQKRYLFVVLALTIGFLFLPGATALHTESEELAECADPDELGGEEEGSGNETENGTSDENATDEEDEASLLETIDATLNETTSDADEAFTETGGCVYDEVPETWNCDRILGRNACVGTNTDNCRLQIIYGLGFCIIF